MYDFTRTICTTSYTLYKAPQPYFMRSHHIMYDIPCTVFLTSLPLYLTWHPLYLCHQDQCINYTTPTLCMTSHTLSVWHHSQYAWHHMNTLWRHIHIGMTSQRVYLWHHNNIYDINATAFMKTNDYTWYLTHYILHHSHCICAATPAVLLPPQQLWKLYQLVHGWYHTHSTWHHNHTLWHHSSVCMTSQPLHSRHQIPYMWYHLQGLRHLIPYTCDITDTMFVNTYQQYLSSNTRCRCNTTTISKIITSICVSVWSHRVYPWYNTHCIDDMAPTLFMAHYALYMTSHPQFMTSQHSIHYISLLYLISNWLYLTAHPQFLCHHTQIIGHITQIVYRIKQAQYVRYHMNTYVITSTLYDITPRYDIHTHCTHAITARVPVIASTVAELLLTVYWL